ncbi:ornithine--oxo-acid transaminase [Tessaracoccus sp. Y36]
MSTTETAPAPTPIRAMERRTAQHRRYLMCRPEHFTVTYAINPWMEPGRPTDTARAIAQWQKLHDLYLSLGHEVELIEPVPGYPDMVYTANGGFLIDGRAYLPKCLFEERAGEAPAFAEWFRTHGFDTVEPTEVNEGEGDFLLVGNTILAGTGFRSTDDSHREVGAIFGRDVVSLNLIDARYYHLDTAIAVLDPVQGTEHGAPARATIAYQPGAFDAASRAILEDRYPDAIRVSDEDGAVFGLNCVSDGYNVVIAPGAEDFANQLRARGYNPIPLDLSELLLGGGGIKCCTLELRGSHMATAGPHPEGAEAHVAHNYHPLPVTIASAEGVWMTDVDGRRYLDLLAAYSAVNFGHRHPALVDAATRQLERVTLTSRAFMTDRLEPFAEALARLCGKDMVLPMNTGAEAVETGIKVARAWGYRVKGIPADKARIIVAAGNFHGRTTTIISFSDDPVAHNDFGPFTPGFDEVPYGDADAIAAAITEETAAVLIEPIQGEAGVIIPPRGYLRRIREICDERNVLFIADEIQSGLGRVGETFACDREGVAPDLYLLGKALGGGILPVSAVVGDRAVLGVLRPGEHGSTFGGNPLAAAVGLRVVEMLETGEFQERARRLGEHLAQGLGRLLGHGVTAIRVAGLWAGVDIDPPLGTGREISEKLMARGVLVKDTHGQTIRIAPPLVIGETEIDWALEQLRLVLES